MGFNTTLTNMLLLSLLLHIFQNGTSIDTITSSQFIKDSETLTSNNTDFHLGFFSPSKNTTNRYLGIWYVSDSNVIWVANRNQPLHDLSGVVTISHDRNLVVLNGNKDVIWTSNIISSSNSTAKLLNSGNLVLLDDTGKHSY